MSPSSPGTMLTIRCLWLRSFRFSCIPFLQRTDSEKSNRCHQNYGDPICNIPRDDIFVIHFHSKNGKIPRRRYAGSTISLRPIRSHYVLCCQSLKNLLFISQHAFHVDPKSALDSVTFPVDVIFSRMYP